MIYTPKLAEYMDELDNSVMLPENDNDVLEAYQIVYNRTLELIEAMKVLNNTNA